MPVTALLTSLEVTALVRDIVLIVFLILAMFAFVVFGVIAVLLFRRVARVLDRTEQTLDRTEVAVGAIADGLGIVSQWAGLLSFGSLLGRLFGRKGDS